MDEKFGSEIDMTAFAALMLLACMLAMVGALMWRRYALFVLFFVLSTASMTLLLSQRYGFTLKVVMGATGSILAVVLIGVANYWLRRHSVDWVKANWNKRFKPTPPSMKE